LNVKRLIATAFIVLGGILAWLQYNNYAGQDRPAAHVPMAGGIPVEFAGHNVILRVAYQTNTLFDTVSSDCGHKVRPAMPNAQGNGNIAEAVVRFDIDGQPECIVVGRDLSVGEVTLRVIATGNQHIDTTYFNEIALSERPNAWNYWLPVLAGLLFGGGTGILVNLFTRQERGAGSPGGPSTDRVIAFPKARRLF
jgi:hypothetical protein